MKILTVILSGLITLAACSQKGDSLRQSQQDSSAYILPLPKDWSSEKFEIPMSFAPEIPFTGVEEVRFHPHWGDATKPGYWTYSFMWFVREKQLPAVDTLSIYLERYYEGIAKVNSSDSLLRTTDIAAKVRLRETSVDNELKSFEGEASIFDFMAAKRMTINIRLNIRNCGESVAYIYEISPQNYDHAVWTELKALTESFRCENYPKE